MLPAHRRPFADYDSGLLRSFLGKSMEWVEIVARAELTHRGEAPTSMQVQQTRSVAAFTAHRLERATSERAASFDDPLVEIAEHHAGLLRYDKSDNPGRYAVALKCTDGRWARFECLRLAGGTFEATPKGVHPNLNFALAPSSRGGPKVGPGGRKVKTWQARVTAGTHKALMAILPADTERSDLVREALALHLWLATDGDELLTGIEATLRVVRMGIGPLRPHEAEQLEQLVKALRGGDDG